MEQRGNSESRIDGALRRDALINDSTAFEAALLIKPPALGGASDL